jgi:choline dehydrogenase-like flavoprotein
MNNSNPGVKNFGLVGAGPVGIFLSFLLIEKGHKVTLYEAGGRESESTNLNLSNYVFKTKSKIPSGVHRVGGASNLWKRRVSEFSSEAFNRVDEKGNRVWPIDFDDLRKAYAYLFTLLDREGLGDQEYMKKYCNQLSSDMPLIFGLNLFRFCDEGFFKSLLAKLESSENFSLVIDSLVVEIRQKDVINKDGNGIELILAKSGSPELENTFHSDVVLTGGCLQSTALAMKSIDILTRLPAPDLVGKFLMEHFDGYVGTLRIRKKNIKTLRKFILDEDRRTPTHAFGVGLTIPSKSSEVYPAIDFHLEFVKWRKTYLFDPNLNVFNRLPPRAYRALFLLERVFKKVPSELRSLWFKASSTEIYSVWLKGEEIPFANSSLQISQGGHERDKKLIYNHRVSKETKILMRQRLSELSNYVKVNNLGKFRVHSYFRFNSVFYTGPNFHPMGTLRMGFDPKNSIVGPDFAFHGSSHVFAINSGIFPNGSNHNPTALVLALSIVFASVV